MEILMEYANWDGGEGGIALIKSNPNI